MFCFTCYTLEILSLTILQPPHVSHINYPLSLYRTPSPIPMPSTNAQLEPLPQPFSNLRGNQIHMSILETYNRKFAITSKYNYYDQWNSDPINANLQPLCSPLYIITDYWMMESMHAQTTPSSKSSSILRGEKIRMSGLDKAYINISSSPKDKYQSQ